MLKEEAVRPGPSPQAHRLMCWLPGDQAVPSLEWVAGRRCVCPRPVCPFYALLPEPSLTLVGRLPGQLTKS